MENWDCLPKRKQYLFSSLPAYVVLDPMATSLLTGVISVSRILPLSAAQNASPGGQGIA